MTPFSDCWLKLISLDSSCDRENCEMNKSVLYQIISLVIKDKSASRMYIFILYHVLYLLNTCPDS